MVATDSHETTAFDTTPADRLHPDRYRAPVSLESFGLGLQPAHRYIPTRSTVCPARPSVRTCVCARACVRACVCVSALACVRACRRAYARGCVHAMNVMNVLWTRRSPVAGGAPDEFEFETPRRSRKSILAELPTYRGGLVGCSSALRLVGWLVCWLVGWLLIGWFEPEHEQHFFVWLTTRKPIRVWPPNERTNGACP